MADPSDKVKQNVGGRFFVDHTCIYCDLCVETAPTVFREDKEEGFAFVHRQPLTKEEIDLATEALEGCPTESIGDHDNPGLEFAHYHGESSDRKWWQIWKR